MTAKIRLLRHTTPGRLLSEIGAELGSPLLEFGQLGPQAPDLAVDERQLRPGLLFADVTRARAGTRSRAPPTRAPKAGAGGSRVQYS
ncbi:MAG: hypothetical protein ACHP9Z_30195, partial [Streptosporangiales bacterium]